jgi:hypothetical protein
MSCDDATHRAWWIALAILLMIAAGVWVLLVIEGEGAPRNDPTLADGQRRVIDGEMLEGTRPEDPPRGADLEARPGASGERALPARGSVIVHAIGPTGAPLGAVTVTLFEQEGGKGTARDAQTDGLGRVTFTDVRFDGSARAVLLYADRPDTGSTECASATITSDVVELHSQRGLPLLMTVIRADRGHAVPDAHMLTQPFLCGLAGAAPAIVTAAAVEPGPGARVQATLHPVPRYVSKPSVSILFPFPPDVVEAHGVRPLWREAEIVLVAKPDQALPAAKPTHAMITVGRNAFERTTFEVDGFGRIRVGGVPFQPHLPLHASVRFSDGSVGTGQARTGSGPSVAVSVELEIREEEEPVIKDEDIEDHEETLAQDSPDPGASPGNVTLRLTRIDGTPGRHAWAVLRPLDGGPNNWRKANEAGVVSWQRWRPGRYHLSVWGIGGTHTQEVDVVAGKETVASIRGSEGGRLRVTVRDQEGQPLPFSVVRVTDSELFRHADVRGRRLRIDPYTDRAGERTFHRLRPGTVAVRARYGGYETTGKAEVLASRTAELDLVLDLSK